MNWQKLVDERNEWVARNFPDEQGRPEQSVFGVVEELGELAHAHLKEQQGIRGTAEEHQAAAKDAIGDLTVYLLGIMRYYELPSPLLSDGYIAADADDALLHLAAAVGRLSSCLTVGSVLAPNDVTTGRIAGLSRAYCKARGWDYDAIVLETWGKVSQRDWAADPVAGGESSAA